MQVSLERGDNDDFHRIPLLSAVTPTNNDNVHNPRLPLALRLLCGLNGATLSLPITALLYIVNTRASIPLSYLSAYGAVVFLPCSLKPFYAYMSSCCCCCGQKTRRNNSLVLIALFIANGICHASTSLIPHGGIMSCFLFGFSRGLLSAWSEFLLGRALVQHSSRHVLLLLRNCGCSHVTVAHSLQSEAATARNLGSTVATLTGVLFLVHSPTLNDDIVTLLLITTAILHLVAAMITFVFQVGYCCSDTTTATIPMQPLVHPGPDSTNDNSSIQLLLSSRFPNSQQDTTNAFVFTRENCLLLIIFQIAIIVVSLQEPIVRVTSETCWIVLVLVFLVLMLLLLLVVLWTKQQWPNNRSSATISSSWQTSYRVGLFLMARHSIPTCDYLMKSFLYSLLESKPMLLQFLSVTNMGISTLSSWSYGRLFAKSTTPTTQHQELSLTLVIAGTTIVSSFVGLGNLIHVDMAPHNHQQHSTDWTWFMLIVVMDSITTWTAEWQLLPDVVLATATTVQEHHQQQQQQQQQQEYHPPFHFHDNDSNDNNAVSMQQQAEDDETSSNDSERSSQNTNHTLDSMGMLYGTLISCIDFGDQIGAWVTVPLVTMLGIRRDNDWANLDSMIILTFIFNLMSMFLLCILRQ